jgi:hypothetical protein
MTAKRVLLETKINLGALDSVYVYNVPEGVSLAPPLLE